jgi:hypothetical protein
MARDTRNLTVTRLHAAESLAMVICRACEGPGATSGGDLRCR